MTAPLYLVAAGTLDGVVAGAEIELDGDEAHHAVTVRRTRVGEQVDLADGSGRRAACVVTRVEPGRRTVLAARVVRLERLAPRSPRLVLVQALAKGGRDETAVETATELGVDAVVPWQAERSVVVWSGERGARSHAKWQAVAQAAAKQSRRAVLPVVEPLVTTATLAVRVQAVIAAGGGVLLLHEAAGLPLTAATAPRPGSDGELLVVVGPEGGVADAELARLTEAGALAVRLGPEVLRSSSAGPAALAVLSARLGRWS